MGLVNNSRFYMVCITDADSALVGLDTQAAVLVLDVTETGQNVYFITYFQASKQIWHCPQSRGLKPKDEESRQNKQPGESKGGPH